MIPVPWCLWLALFVCMLIAGLAVTDIALTSLSGGLVRRIAPVDSALAEKLGEWLLRREELRASVRFLIVLNVLCLIFCLSSWDAYCAASGSSGGTLFKRFFPAAFGAVIYVAVVEYFSGKMIGITAGRFLHFVLPTISRATAWVAFIFYPFRLWSRRRRDPSRADARESGVASAEDEILSIVAEESPEHNGDPTIEADERRMIKGVFDLDETLVREIMTPRVDVHAMPDSSGIDEVRRCITETGHSRIPIYRDTIDHVTGVIHAKDLLGGGKVDDQSTAGDLCRNPVLIPETKNIGDLLAEFQQNRNHFAAVLDEYGGTAGIITFEDILEEIVGEIRDEYDIAEIHPDEKVLPDGTIVADGRLTIDQLNDSLALDMPEDEDFDTLGGYIVAQEGRIPEVGESLETEHLSVEVLGADKRRVTKAGIRPRKDEPGPGRSDASG